MKQLKLIPALLTLVLGVFVLRVHAQDVVGRVNGTVTESVTGAPLAGVEVRLLKDSTTLKGALTDADGNYNIENVPVGRYALSFAYPSYRGNSIPDVNIFSAKTLVVDVAMEEMVVDIKEVKIVASKNGEAVNEMVSVSGRAFSPAEAERYAGSRGDPARMASNFAGVQGTDDTRNDLVIRGNSPLGVAYRLEGVNIPNPNHFAVTGSAGGPVGMLNNKVLASSDFLTGAFPAEFGNSLAGSFDLKLRKGITNRHEFILQAGIFGAEATGEGPLGKANASGQRASYLFNFRYATLSLFSAMGIDIGTTAIPKYRDMAFKVNVPMKKGGEFSIFGMGGYSRIDFIVSDDKKQDSREIYANSTQDEFFRSGVAVGGARLTKLNGTKGIFRATLAYSREQNNVDHFTVWRHLTVPDSLYALDSITRKMGFLSNLNKALTHFYYRHKLSARQNLQFGLMADSYLLNLQDSFAVVSGVPNFTNRMHYQGNQVLFQPYAQWRYNASEKLTFNLGLHGQVFTLNKNSMSLEPRAGLRWAFSPTQTLSFGTGLHSQMQPYYIYYQQLPNGSGGYTQQNLGLGFSRSVHFVAGHDWYIGKSLRTKLESYYQYLFNVPVDTFPSSFSMLNQGSGFERYFPGKLVNEGTGRNIGIELTVEKFFSHNWFLMGTASFFDSKYQGSDGRTYNTDFNSKYVANVLGTKEFNWGKKRKVTFGLGGKFTYAGGKRYSPLDTLASVVAEEAVPVSSLRNTLQFRNYFRMDLKLYYRINAAKLTHEIGIDLVNLTGQKNLLRYQYVGGTQMFTPVSQLGFLPIFYYRVNFAVGKKTD